MNLTESLEQAGLAPEKEIPAALKQWRAILRSKGRWKDPSLARIAAQRAASYRDYVRAHLDIAAGAAPPPAYDKMATDDLRRILDEAGIDRRSIEITVERRTTLSVDGGVRPPAGNREPAPLPADGEPAIVPQITG